MFWTGGFRDPGDQVADNSVALVAVGGREVLRVSAGWYRRSCRLWDGR